VNIDTTDSGNAEEIRLKPLASEYGQDEIRGRSAELIEKTGIVHVVNLDPGDSVRLKGSRQTTRAQGRSHSTQEADHLPHGPGTNPVDPNSVTHTVS
jgi:hypothetical protein